MRVNKPQAPEPKKPVTPQASSVVEDSATLAAEKAERARKAEEYAARKKYNESKREAERLRAEKVAKAKEEEYSARKKYNESKQEAERLRDEKAAEPVVEEPKKSESAKKAKGAKKGSSKLKKGIAALAIGASLITVGFGAKNYLNPQIVDVPDSLSGGFAVQEYGKVVSSYNVDGLKQVDDKSFLAREESYANNDASKSAFIKAVTGTVKYSVPEVQAMFKNGKPAVKNKQPVMIESDLTDDDKVSLTYVDWSKVDTSPTSVQAYLKANNLTLKDPDFQQKLTGLFAKYIVDQAAKPTSKPSSTPSVSSSDGSVSGSSAAPVPQEESSNGLPVKTVEWSPSLEKYEVDDPDNKGKKLEGQKVSSEEDANIDSLLFGSMDFLKAQTKFSESATGQKASAEWYKFLESKTGGVPPEIGNLKFINPDWIGAYRLQQGIVEVGTKSGQKVAPVLPPVGDGSKEQPAGQNTSVMTSVLVTDKGKVVKNPVRVELVDIKRDQDAIDFFESKDVRNRGLTTASQVKYASFKFKVTNLGTKAVTVTDNSTLSDDQANITSPTGKVFGLTSSVVVKPSASGIVESWAGSPTLDMSYLIWGKDFNRQVPVVWFRVLGASDGKVTKQAEKLPDAQVTPADGTGMVEGANNSSPNPEASSSPSSDVSIDPSSAPS